MPLCVCLNNKRQSRVKPLDKKMTNGANYDKLELMREIQLIQIYDTVCYHYDSTLSNEAQRLTNNFCPKFTDAECIATYIFGIANQKFNNKACYEFIFIKDFYPGWFPDMPGHKAYNARICYLADTIKALAGILLCGLGFNGSHADFVMDSMPIVVAGHKRSSKAKAAAEICSKGYCASKGIWYYGAKLHILAQRNYKTMPTPAAMMTSKASVHDIDIGEEMLFDVHNIRVFCDMAYANKHWQDLMLTKNNVTIVTPIKRSKGQEQLSCADKLFSRAVSSVKQTIESLNNWLIEKTNIQRASKVRSAAGLTAFVFARVACGCLVF